MTSDHYIVGLHIHDRVKQAPDIQKVLTKYGCNIKTRLGMHDVDGQYCAANGLVLLEMVGETATIDQMVRELSAFESADVKTMVFKHS